MPAEGGAFWLRSLQACISHFTQFSCEAWSSKRCPLCLDAFSPTHSGPGACLCQGCSQRITPFTKACCPLCGTPSASEASPLVPCGACLTNPPPWQAVSFYALYQGLLKDVLLRFKYGEDLTLVPLLGYLMGEAAARFPSVDLMVPMPRHAERLRERGFNQVLELARPVEKVQHIRLDPFALSRTRHTQPQAALPAKERARNPQGSFEAVHVAGKHVLLLDDIMTTGATLRHAAEALHKAGAASVRVAVVARAVLRSDAF